MGYPSVSRAPGKPRIGIKRKAEQRVFDKRPTDTGQCRADVCVRARLVKVLRELREQCNTRPVFAGEGVKGVRDAGKFMAAMDAADALLKELGEC